MLKNISDIQSSQAATRWQQLR